MGAPTGANGSCYRDPTRAPRRAPSDLLMRALRLMEAPSALLLEALRELLAELLWSS